MTVACSAKLSLSGYAVENYYVRVQEISARFDRENLRKTSIQGNERQIAILL